MMNKEALWASGILLLLLTAPVSAVPPVLIGPDAEAPDEATIAARVAYWFDQIGTADDPEMIADAQEQLAKDYLVLSQPQNRYRYAADSSRAALALLSNIDATDALRINRELNTAMAVAKMDQVSAQPAIRTFIAHPNEAVRYWGWRGYRTSLAVFLAQGGQAAQAVFNDVQNHAGKETSALVNSAIFDLFDLPLNLPDTVATDDWNRTAKLFFDVLISQWTSYCLGVQSGQEDWIHSARKAVIAMTRLGRLLAEDPEATTAALQSLLEMSWASYAAYDALEDEDPTVDVLAAVLFTCEESLRGLSGKDDTPIKTALTMTSRRVGEESLRIRSKSERSPFVGDAVRGRWLALLKDHGVTKPQLTEEPEGEGADGDGEDELNQPPQEPPSGD